MSLSLHERIRRDIEAAILSGELRPGARLPIELELMQQYGCSRMTVSKALSALGTAGLIDRRKRAGSFVARPKVHSMVLDIPDLEQEITQRGQVYRYQPLRREIRRPKRASADEIMLAGKGDLLLLEGLHFADDMALALEERLVSLTAVPDMTALPLDGASPGAWLLKHVPWTEAETRIAAVAADPVTADLLQVHSGTACLFVERRTWRGSEEITLVRQHFVGTSYNLIARFGSARRTPDT